MELQNLLVKDSSKSPQTVLQYIQDHKLQEPALVLKLALPLWKNKTKKKNMHHSLLRHHKIEASVQHLSLLEQIVIAALFEKEHQLAGDALTEIKITAGANSLRYRKLLALCLEASEKYDDALEIYHDMLSENPSNVYALKRKYVILRSQLLDLEARKCLNDYLEQNGSDATAWVEMAKTCMEQGDYKGAAYCYEEVVLFSPMDANVHCTLGELYVTIGGDKEYYALARKHFAQCLEFDKGHVRAMFGLVSATECYLEEGECMEKKEGVSKELENEELELVRDLRAYAVEHLYKSCHDDDDNNDKEDNNIVSSSSSSKGGGGGGGTNMRDLLEIVLNRSLS